MNFRLKTGFDFFFQIKMRSSRVVSAPNLRFRGDPEVRGSSPGVAAYLVWNGGQECDSVSSARVNPALNGYLEDSGGNTGSVG